MRVALKVNPSAIETAFGFVGHMAMQELLQYPNVELAMMNYIVYTDVQAI